MVASIEFFRCEECIGEGVLTVLPASCNHGGQNCPCRTDEIQCSACRGTGRELCAFCGKQPASELSLDDDRICAGCATEEADMYGPALREAVA